MMDHARKGSTLVSRYGGEEFILLLPDSRVEEARRTGYNLINFGAPSMPDDLPHRKSTGVFVCRV
ncbi:MAG: hypothetical protein GX874_04130 [Smithella sp.]|nr:hypothetical protein [Smithella sp.]